MRRFKTVGLLDLISRIKPQALIKVTLVKTVLDLCGCLVLLASCGRVSEVVTWPFASLWPFVFPWVYQGPWDVSKRFLSWAISFIWEKVQPSNTFVLPTSSAIRPLSMVLVGSFMSSSCPVGGSLSYLPSPGEGHMKGNHCWGLKPSSEEQDSLHVLLMLSATMLIKMHYIF